MGDGGEFDIKTLLERLQPGAKHARAGIGCAGRKASSNCRVERCVVTKLDVEDFCFWEDSMIAGDGKAAARQTDCAAVQTISVSVAPR